MIEPTPKQQQIMGFVESEAQAGRPAPTLREIAARFGFRSHRAAACHLEALKRKGFIESEPGKVRALRVVTPLQKLRSRVADIPLFGSIPAGFADEREAGSRRAASPLTSALWASNRRRALSPWKCGAIP